MSKTITTIKGQTIADIAVQEYGNREAVNFILGNNPDLQNDYPLELPLERRGMFDFAYPLIEGQSVTIIEDPSLKAKLDRSYWGTQVISGDTNG